MLVNKITGQLTARSLGNTVRNFSRSTMLSNNVVCKILIVGGGSGGCAMAAKLSSKFKNGQVLVLEDADNHYYQPMFTMIGGGMKKLEQSYRPMCEVIPKNAKWMKEKALKFEPKSNSVITSSGNVISYDALIIATGLQLNYDKIPGLEQALLNRTGNVCSNYSPKYVNRTYELLQKIQNGNAIFTFPNTPVKCPGAPQKIMYIAEHFFRKKNKRNNINIFYNTALPVLFGVKHYSDALWPICNSRNIHVNLNTNLVEVRPDENVAVFQYLDRPGESYEESYSMLHVVPPMSTPDELSRCKELVNAAGFVDVHKNTLQHTRYNNVFAIGDCSSTPNSKTTAAVAAQSPVVLDNILAFLAGKEPTAKYDGYASCPLITGYDKVILAEFDYDLKPLETFPIPQNIERRSMFFMKATVLPPLYWNMMLSGYWDGPEQVRNLFSYFNFGKKNKSY